MNFISPASALAVGVALALAFGNPWAVWTKKTSKTLLQISVVLLGFNMNLADVWHAGSRGFFFAMASIVATFVIGMTLASKWKVSSRIAVLICAGTAICGGSAIAAVASAIQAQDDEISVSAGVIFLLNALGLLLFPWIGHAVGMSDSEFGLWAGIAIHDVSSVAGAAAAYGGTALAVAMPVKLSRVLWIAPVALVAGKRFAPSGAGKKSPWIQPFILMFIAAAAIRSWVPALEPVSQLFGQIAKIGFTLTLFLIGAGLTRASLKAVGWKPLILAAGLWACMAVGTWITLKFLPNYL